MKNKYGTADRREYQKLWMREWRRNHVEQSRASSKRRYEARKARKAAEGAADQGIHEYSKPQNADSETDEK